MSTYLIPTALDIPTTFETIILENPSPIGPFGAVGVGELPTAGGRSERYSPRSMMQWGYGKTTFR